MAHELENRNDMVFVGETPWHGLGEKVDSILNLPKCLDWDVTAKAIYHNRDGEFVAIDGKSALIRQDTGRSLGVVSDRYQIHQNPETWQVMQRFAEDGHLTIDTAGTLKGGEIVWCLAKINKSFGVTDKQELYALLATSHGGLLATTVKAVATRVVCHNTLTLALREKSGAHRQTHRSKFDRRIASEFVAEAILGFEDYQAKVEKLQSVEFNGYNRALSEAFVAELLAPQILEKAIEATGKTVDVERKSSLIEDIIMREDSRRLFVESLEGDVNRPLRLALHDVATEQAGIAGKTPWGLYNGITRYVDHTHGRSADSRLTNAWFGAGEQLKASALDLAIEYTDALRHA